MSTELTNPQLRRETNESGSRPLTQQSGSQQGNDAGRPSAVQNPLIPDDEELLLIGINVNANKVASPTTISAILAEAQRAFPGATAGDLVSLAWACYHNGSSRYTTLVGTTSHNISLAALKDITENHCTLRQFCMYYAKICYNLGRKLNKPPANWMAKGFKENTKFAAFDFFNGVNNEASPKPRGGMEFTPSAEEVAAAAVNSTMAIVESREPNNQFSTRGNMLAMQQVRAPERPPLITFE